MYKTKTATLKEMQNWNYKTAWKFFTESAVNRIIPETESYIRSLPMSVTYDCRYDNTHAKEQILKSINKKSLILIDGAGLNGKTTFANRLSKHINATIVDIDFICIEWIEEQLKNIKSPADINRLLLQMDKMTDVYLLENLEKIVKKHSQKGNVILVGCYMEVIYRAIIARTLGRYFEQTISMYSCAKQFEDVIKMKESRDKEFGYSVMSLEETKKQYEYSKRLIYGNGVMLGYGMAYSYIVDRTVSDLFIV